MLVKLLKGDGDQNNYNFNTVRGCSHVKKMPSRSFPFPPKLLEFVSPYYFFGSTNFLMICYATCMSTQPFDKYKASCTEGVLKESTVCLRPVS